jgi:hypothetical protein
MTSMGVAKDQKQAALDKRGRRGSTNNEGRLDAFKRGVGKGEADWGGCDPKNLQAVVVAITELGGAVTLGLSRDQGAHSLTLMLDRQRETLWFNGGADLDDELDRILAMIGALE